MRRDKQEALEWPHRIVEGRIEYWDDINNYWIPCVLNCITWFPANVKMLTYNETWCEPYQGMEE